MNRAVGMNQEKMHVLKRVLPHIRPKPSARAAKIDAMASKQPAELKWIESALDKLFFAFALKSQTLRYSEGSKAIVRLV